jgi:hypothetical protein
MFKTDQQSYKYKLLRDNIVKSDRDIREDILPVGVVDYDNSLSGKTIQITDTYYKEHSLNNVNYPLAEFLSDVANSVGEARSLFALKKLNVKGDLKKNLKDIATLTNKMIGSLRALENDHYSLAILRREILKEKNTVGYGTYKKLIDPGHYADTELDVLLPVIDRAFKIVQQAAELRTTDWQAILCRNLLEAQLKLTSESPPKTSSCTSPSMPPIYTFVDKVSLNEFKQGTSETKVKEEVEYLREFMPLIFKRNK